MVRARDSGKVESRPLIFCAISGLEILKILNYPRSRVSITLELSKLVFQTNNQWSYSLTSYLFMEKNNSTKYTVVQSCDPLFNENCNLRCNSSLSISAACSIIKNWPMVRVVA